MPKPLIISLFLTSILLSSCGSASIVEKTEVPKKSVVTEVVKSDYFTEQVKFVGKVAPEKETIVSAQVSGVIKSLNVDIGKHVKKGDILATLDFSTTAVGANLNNAQTAYSNTLATYGLTKESTDNDLENARIALENARTNKENTYISTEKQLKLAQLQLDNILTQKGNTEKTTTLSVELATKSRDQAKTALENFEKTSKDTLVSNKENVSGLYSSTQTSMENALITIDSAITQADTMLGITDANKNLNDGYETYLGAKNIQFKSMAETAFQKSYTSYKTILDAKNTLSGATDVRLIDIIALMNNTISLYDAIISLLDNSIVGGQFTQTTLDGLKATMIAKQSVLTQTNTSLIALSNSIVTTRTQLETALTIAETSLQNAIAGTTSSLDGITGTETLTRTQLENTIATVKTARDSVDSALKIAEAQYKSTQAKLQSQLTGVKSQLDASKGQKDIAGIQAENGLIRAPFDGVILSKKVELGTLINPGTPFFTIGDDSNLIVQMDVNSDIITSLSLGQIIKVVRDSTSSTGTISLLAPGLDITTRMFHVEAILSDDAFSKEFFHIGDFVDVFMARMKSDSKSITIPFSSLISDGQGGFVVYTVGTGNIAERKSVKTGAQNESHIEILSGIIEGEKVVISGVLSLQDGDEVVEKETKK